MKIKQFEDLKYISNEEFSECYNLSIEIITQLANFIKYLSKSN